MTMYGMRHFFGRTNTTRAVKATVGLLGMAVLGYVVITLVEHTLPSLSASSGFTVERQMANPAPATEMADAPATSSVAAASVPPASPSPGASPQVGYFPRGYVNRATTIGEQSPTF